MLSLEFVTNHLFVWVVMFLAGLTASAMCGVYPFSMNGKDVESVLGNNKPKKAFAAISLIAAIFGEYAFLAGVITLAVRAFNS